MLSVRFYGYTISTVLADVVFPFPISAAPEGFTIDLVMYIADTVAAVFSKSVVLEKAATVATFPVRTFLVGTPLIFGA